MEVRVLRYFIEVVNEGNISNAAKHLHISQPTLSRQLMNLEDELGITLFERGHQQIKLTQQGYYLYDHAQEITRLVDKTENNLKSQKLISGTLEIGAGESIALQDIMSVVAKIIRKYSTVKINLVSGDSNFICQRLNDGSLDFGIVMGKEKLNDYYSINLSEKNIWGVLVRQDLPLACKEVITPDDLIGTPIIISSQSKYQDTFRDWAGSKIDQFNIIGEYNLIFNARLLTETGACIALTYQDLINTTGTNLVFRPLTPVVADQNNLIWNKNRQLSNVAQIFLDLIKTNH
ncbi:LysR family transcriptional regulator [Limosilactobacillus fastidiosus]|uniref:LysR family transcriptional regulator n=1 Tax=Limosilactobacillus fastidiosus TaxID=2759855 RepID=A0A7W3YCL2_9LACO|nr:LysR family transcriptional regulator [Limosilactobacillus fastidiosus]MBB1063563.1 LysR family transcriptional regulator [Limosilactobacillus fastidiosus]MBB1086340.1 LysR family transcriptional regulator [Limosilactobacillus fastidiosus]MCD7084005.1 LysR family transcriptional regulator [Limosilactobacillus fastidiosus]MCD7086445.1 LysR family transcriptional regulator [Limosilactobacillus fastidiosus]MCD7114199.1 LysR family transcriptional regulator [Limosilactobacillus fastidiosus]